MSTPMTSSLTTEQAQAILSKHVENTPIIMKIEPVTSPRIPGVYVYTLYTSSKDCCYVLKLKGSARSRVGGQAKPELVPSYAPNPLAVEHTLLTHLHVDAATYPLSIPIPKSLAYVDVDADADFDDVTSENPVYPSSYLLLVRPSGAVTTPSRLRTHLSTLSAPVDGNVASTHLDFRFGYFFRSLHAVDQEYYGRHDTPTNERLLSWEEQFLTMLEEVLDVVNLPGVDMDKVTQARSVSPRGGEEEGQSIPVETIRTLLARAIGSYLFDGIEWPHLIASPLHEPELVFIYLPHTALNLNPDSPITADERIRVVCMLPNGLPYALWADPAFERIMHTIGSHTSTPAQNSRNWPSEAFTAAYAVGEPTHVPLPREKTKALWYRLYGALVRVVEDSHGDEEGHVESSNEETRDEARKAKEEVLRLVEVLKTAPCY